MFSFSFIIAYSTSNWVMSLIVQQVGHDEPKYTETSAS